MCRLFGLHAGVDSATATFWLLDAPDSLAAQSHRNPDGAGIGVFGADGVPQVDKQPIAAWDDVEFATAARERTGTTFIAHVRHASTGELTMANTHPFEQDGRLLAHNGVVGDLDALDRRLSELGARGLVRGETDSERLFALITAQIAARHADVTAGLIDAVEWISDNLAVYSINLILTTATDLWALRYPATNELWLLQRPAGGTDTRSGLEARTDRIHARSEEFADRASVVIASEPMDSDSAWRLLRSGELLHVRADLTVESSIAFPDQPRKQLSLADLGHAAAISQQSRPSAVIAATTPERAGHTSEPDRRGRG